MAEKKGVYKKPEAKKPAAKPKAKKAAKKKESYASESSHKALARRVTKLEQWQSNAETIMGNRGGIDIRLLDPNEPQQPQEHEEEMESTAPMPVEKAAKLADEEVPPHYKDEAGNA